MCSSLLICVYYLTLTVIPETEEEKKLYETAERRYKARNEHRKASRDLAATLSPKRRWERD